MVSVTGFEPATTCAQGKSSTSLSYTLTKRPANRARLWLRRDLRPHASSWFRAVLRPREYGTMFVRICQTNVYGTDAVSGLAAGNEYVTASGISSPLIRHSTKTRSPARNGSVSTV